MGEPPFALKIVLYYTFLVFDFFFRFQFIFQTDAQQNPSKLLTYRLILKVFEIKSGCIRIGAVAKVKRGQDHCPLLEALSKLETAQERHRARLLALIEHAAKHSLGVLSTEQCHRIDRNENIYEFIAGPLRVPFFKLDSGKVVLCTHVFLKKSQKTPRREVQTAIRQKKLYEAASSVEWKE